MDAVYRVAPYDTAAIHEALLGIEPFDAITGDFALGADGDRLGSLALLNVQIDEDRSLVPTPASGRLVTRTIGTVDRFVSGRSLTSRQPY